MGGIFASNLGQRMRFLCLAFAPSVFPLPAAYADVVISSGTTSNMSCSGGACAPTASDAVLNVSDLESMLASGNVTVTTTGSGVQAYNVDVEAPLTWSTGSFLTLEASAGIAVDRVVSVTGQGGLSLATDGAITALTLGSEGRIAFQNLSSQLTINETTYTLANNIASLASAIASNPSGSYALAGNYDASQDGTYGAAPIQSIFFGVFDGLGNTISNLSIKDQSPDRQNLGLFFDVADPGTVEHIRLARVEITGGRGKQGEFIGALIGGGSGYVFQGSASGKIQLQGRIGVAGGLVGAWAGNVASSSTEVTVDATKSNGGSWAGGLMGANVGLITESFATGSVAGGKKDHVGGLVGQNSAGIQNSYSTGVVSGGDYAEVGGLIGRNRRSGVTAVYSTGAVSGGSASYVGGFAGLNGTSLSDTYWDTDTSGTNQAVGKGNSRGITGLTTQQLQSGLPNGFNRSVWKEISNINNGLPYLKTNPPPK